jgi:hypothetical protein
MSSRRPWRLRQRGQHVVGSDLTAPHVASANSRSTSIMPVALGRAYETGRCLFWTKHRLLDDACCGRRQLCFPSFNS